MRKALTVLLVVAGASALVAADVAVSHVLTPPHRYPVLDVPINAKEHTP